MSVLYHLWSSFYAFDLNQFFIGKVSVPGQVLAPLRSTENTVVQRKETRFSRRQEEGFERRQGRFESEIANDMTFRFLLTHTRTLGQTA